MLSFTAHALQCMRWPIGLKLAAALCRMLYFSLVYWLEFRLKLAAGRCRMLCVSAACYAVVLLHAMLSAACAEL